MKHTDFPFSQMSKISFDFNLLKSIILVFALVLPGVFSAQNISGYWQGVAYQPNVGSTDCYPVTIYFVQNGTNLTGTSYTYEAGTPYFAEMNVVGKITGNTVEYDENFIIDKEDAPGFEWCLGYGNLTYNPNTETIKGTLHGTTPSGFPCVDAILEVYRLQILSPLTYCEPGTYTLNLDGHNVKWYADKNLTQLVGSGNSLTRNITQSTTFYVTQTTQFCSTPSPAAEIKVVISDLAFSNTTTVQPTCKSGGSLNLAGSGGKSPYEFSINGGAFQTSGSFINLTAGNYTVILRDKNGCERTQTLTLSAPPSPEVTATASPADCGKQNGMAMASASGGTQPFSFDWENGATTQNIDNLAVGNYEVTATDANGCTATTSVSVPGGTNLPNLSFQIKDAPCGIAAGQIYTSIIGGVSPYDFDWSNGSHAKDLQNLAADEYFLTVTDAAGCSISTSAKVEGTEILTVNFAVDSIFIELGGSDFLTPIFNRPDVLDLKFEWSPTENLSCTDCQSPVASPTEPTIYTIIATDKNGCSGTASVVVEPMLPKYVDVFLPNIFSPNGDGVNDEFEPFFSDGAAFLELKIYDRWGELVFETKNPVERWDGKFRGKVLPSDVFACIFKYKDLNVGGEKLKTGSVALMR